MSAWHTMTGLDAKLCVLHAFQVDPTHGEPWHEAFAEKAALLGYGERPQGHEHGAEGIQGAAYLTPAQPA
jgi:hypothetical protein